METKKIKDIRRRLTSEYQTLIQSLNRKRVAAGEIILENTEDEGDLAAISHDKDLLANLQEGDFARVRLIQEAIKAIDRGHYGECRCCGTEINEKRLTAVPWATLCIQCQEAEEAERTSPRMVMAGPEEEVDL